MIKFCPSPGSSPTPRQAQATDADRDAYARTLAAAQKFIIDKRVQAEESNSLVSKLRQSGVISNYQQTDPVPGPDAERNFATAFRLSRTPPGRLVRSRWTTSSSTGSR
jgi:hypothetical protein